MPSDFKQGKDFDNPLISILKNAEYESQKRDSEHAVLRNSEEYQTELSFLRQTIHDLMQSLRICEIAASRWHEFTQNYLLPRHFDDIVEAALTAQLAIENGALNPARRELRYMLEVAVNIAYVDEVRAKGTLDDRVAYYRGRGVKKSNVDHISQLPFRMLGAHKESFSRSVRDAWVKASNYVHLTKWRIDGKMLLREQGITLGMETLTMLQEIVAEVHEVCSIVMVLTFETIGPSFTGDLLVNSFDEQDMWAFHSRGYTAIIDSYFDYKHERKANLEQIAQRRQGRIRYHATPNIA